MYMHRCIIRDVKGGCDRCATTLTDRKGTSFPVMGGYGHRCTIYNSVPVYMADRAEAIAMISMLSGREHEVVTGTTLRSKDRVQSFSVSSKVSFRVLDNEEIEYYVDRYRPFDKAGAYGIQEWIGYVGIEGIEGSFYNVMGLPVQRLYCELKNF
jgi:hypothetical protein